jgi:hypothetical protein
MLGVGLLSSLANACSEGSCPPIAIPPVAVTVTDAVSRAEICDAVVFRFLLGERHGAVVATAALNRSRHAVGVSNVLSATEQPAQLFPGCVRLAHSTFPGLPLVGYEREQDLSAAAAAGFEEVHGLTVWVPVES